MNGWTIMHHWLDTEVNTRIWYWIAGMFAKVRISIKGYIHSWNKTSSWKAFIIYFSTSSFTHLNLIWWRCYQSLTRNILLDAQDTLDCTTNWQLPASPASHIHTLQLTTFQHRSPLRTKASIICFYMYLTCKYMMLT